MELDLFELMPVVGGFIGMAVLGFILSRIIKKRNIEKLNRLRNTGGVDDESAYSAMVTTEKIAKYLHAQSVDVSKAEELLGLAKQAYGMQSYVVAVSYCNEAKKLLMDSKNKMQVEPSPIEEDPPVPVAPLPVDEVELEGQKPVKEAPEMVRVDKGVERVEANNIEELNGKAEDALSTRNNKLPAKFTIRRAKDTIDKAEKEGRPIDKALDELDKADDAFDAGDFDQALYYANRAKKIADGEDVDAVATPPPKDMDIVEKSESTEELRYYCPSCDNEVQEESVFCRHCGTKLLEELLSCPSCDNAIPADSAFCPKCGQKM